MGSLGLFGSILGGLGALAKIPVGLHQNSLANDIHPEYNPYEESPYAKSQLGLAQQLFNGRTFGAGDLEKNIYASGANSFNNASKAATDSSQLLSLGGLIQGQTDNQLQDLQIKEQQNKYGMLDNLNNAYGAMTQESLRKYQADLEKYKMDTEQKNSLRNAGLQNIFSGIGDLSSLGIMSGQLFGGNPTAAEQYPHNTSRPY
jgi:hypothetical protein